MRNYALLLTWLISSHFGYGQDGFTTELPHIAYWQVGDSEQVVIILHGGPGATHQYLRPEFDSLRKTAKVIYYDQRGCGKSDAWDSYTWQGHVNDLKRLIHTVARDRKVFLAGSSWGSQLAILYSYKHPEDIKGLILSGTIAWYGEEGTYQRSNITPTVLQRSTIIEKRITPKLTVGNLIEYDTLEVIRSYEHCMGLVHDEPMLSRISAPKAERLTQVKVPILLFNGTYDRRWDWVDEYAKLFPNIVLHTLNEAGHDPWFSNPTLFFLICNEFIKKNN